MPRPVLPLVGTSALLCLVPSLAVHASRVPVAAITDRNAFIASTGAQLVDFEGDPLGPVMGQPWLKLGVAFDEFPDGGNTIIGDGGGANRNLYAASGPYADMLVSFPIQPAFAAGVSIFSNDLQSVDEYLLFRGVDGLTIAQFPMPLTGHTGSRFIGIVSLDRPIAEIVFSEGDELDYVGIGDAAFAFAPVPEPSAATLLLAAAGLLGRRRRGEI